MKKLLYIIPVLIAIAAILLWSMRLTVSPGGGMLSISLSSNVAKAEELTTTPVYEAPTVTEDAVNLFTIDFKGAKNRVKIGEGTNNFITKMLFGAFDNECDISLSLVNDVGNFGKATLTGTGENAVITVENNSYKMVYKPTSNTTGFNEQGGVDYFITIKKKTSYNIIDFNMTLNNAVAYHQPPLTQQEIDEGAYRPDHVVNSVAFYHSSKGGTVTGEDVSRGITTGKIGHLYAMRVTDASQKTTWAGWTIEGNILRLTIPLAFLQTATYPVTISPVGDTFGYTSVGASYSNIGLYGPYRGLYACGAAGTGDSISAYLNRDAYTGGHKSAIYSGNNVITNGVTTEITISPGASWRTTNFATSPTLAAASYYLATAAQTNSGTIYFYMDTSGGTHGVDTTAYASVFPDPWGEEGAGSRKYSIYCTYTPSGGIDPPTVTTDSSSNVEETTATLTGTITDTGGENADIRGFQWGTSTGVYSTNVTESGSYGTGQYSLGASSMPEGDLIYWRAEAHNSEGWSYGDELTLHTKPLAPTGLSDTGRTSTSIYLEWVKGTGSENTTIRYRTDQYPTDYNDGTGAYNDTGTSYNVTGLSPGQIYYFRAWAISIDSTATYSDTYSQDTGYTLPGDPTNLSLSNATCNFLDAVWTAGNGGDKSMVRWKEGSYPANESDGNQAYYNTSNSTTITGLPDDTLIYVAVFAYDSDSGYYSSGSSKDNETTLASSDPTVTTDNATNITNTTVRLNATISGLDCENADDTYWQIGLSPGVYDVANFTDTTNRSNGPVYYDVDNLTANTTYYYKACARLNGGAYQCGSEVSFSTSNICTAPTSLRLTVLSDNRILAEWNAVDNITDYLLLVSNIEYPDDPEATYGYAVAYSGANTSAILEGYETDCYEYFFSLWTHCNPYSTEYVTASIGGAGLDELTLSFQNIGGVLIGMVPLIAFSVISFWKENSVMFGLTAGISIAEGFYCYNIDSSPFMFGISLVLWVYAIICLAFGLMCMFKRSPTD